MDIPLNIDDLTPLLIRAMDEDRGGGDITSAATIPAGLQAVGMVVAREPGVLCGGVLLAPLAKLYDPRLRVELLAEDGDRVEGAGVIGRIAGPARSLLAIERVALNFLQRLSGIATATRAYVDAVVGTGAVILDTRKTTPGWRTLEKYAVRCGGGANHRAGLFDAVLVKDNHIALGHQHDLPGLARSLRRKFPDKLIEIEVDTLDQLRSLLAGAADVVDMVLLDNMTPDQLRRAVGMRDELVRQSASPTLRPLFEASGGITMDNVRAIAATGVERVSVGAITHSIKALDIGLDITTPT